MSVDANLNTPLWGHTLLIEDNASHALIIRRGLKRLCATTEHVSSLSALAARSGPPPELVVTDLHLPDSSGVQHVTDLVQRFPSVPVVVLTSSTSLADAVEAMKRGARDFVVKNFEGDFGEILGLALGRLYAGLALEREKLRVEREVATLRVAIENSNDGLAVADPHGAIRYQNSAFAAFGRRAGGTGGDIFSYFGAAIAHASEIVERIRHNLATLEAGAVWHTEVSLSDGSAQAYDLSVSIVRPDLVGVTVADVVPVERSAVLWLRDISEQKRREKFQREILSTTTHDLKGPLGAILISSELLKEMTAGQGKVNELVSRVASSAQGSINLIDEFLSARRIQEGSFILRPQRLQVDQLIESIFTDYQAIAEARGISLTKLPASPVGLCIQADKLGLIRVIGNLISNALKFTPRGGSVTVGAAASEQEVRISVADSGAGMEPGEVRSLFERFHRLEKHRDVPGTGLGLFVVKSIVAAHGGLVDVTSRVGAGTTFTVQFPNNPPVNERGEVIALGFV